MSLKFALLKLGTQEYANLTSGTGDPPGRDPDRHLAGSIASDRRVR
jgi:hypothetical protein